MTLDETIYVKNFKPCVHMKSLLELEKHRLEELIHNEEQCDVGYTQVMISNTLESYKAYLIKSILSNTNPINTIEIMKSLIQIYGLSFDLASYKAAVREIHNIYKEFGCNNGSCRLKSVSNETINLSYCFNS